jgi:hypothetical protein
MRFFGGIALWLFIPAVLMEAFFFGHYLYSGRFSPHKWAGFGGGGLMVLGLIALHMGLMGDMLNRHRVYLEELLYRQREGAWRDPGADATPARSPQAVRVAAHEAEGSDPERSNSETESPVSV